MIAIALSGGGNRGPLQVGALQALFERGIWPDLLVGTSAGALNAVYVAACGHPGCTEELAAIWQSVDRRTIYPGSLLGMAWRVLRGADSLYASDKMREVVAASLPPGVHTFQDLKLPCYITAADLITSRLYLFPDERQPGAPVVDAVMASAAVPGIHPPVRYGSAQLVDGGVVDNVPASIAMDKGATVVYAVNVGYGGGSMSPVHGLLQVLGRTVNTFLAQSLFLDLERAAHQEEVVLHHIHIPDFAGVSFTDFSHTAEMIAAGRRRTDAYLDHPQPRSVQGAPWREPPTPPSAAAPEAPSAAAPEAPSAAIPRDAWVPGAVPYVPAYRR